MKLEEGGGGCGGWCTGHEALLAVGEVGEPEMWWILSWRWRCDVMRVGRDRGSALRRGDRHSLGVVTGRGSPEESPA